MTVPNSDIVKYSLWSDDQLLVELGKELLGEGGLGIGSDDPGGYRRFSQGWLEEQRANICANPSVRELAEPSTGDQILEMTTLADVLAGETTRTAAVLAAVLVARIGLRAFCSGSMGS
ncbi:hypothetical protein [Streptomyces xylophagus]|uniref:hypothetical protein n=1 Tax=Streptomyces xylophagus TaxID=285514 RepID=UPI0005B93188|nr:hypothetical protein [Streptomyces xylophagus]